MKAMYTSRTSPKNVGIIYTSDGRCSYHIDFIGWHEDCLSKLLAILATCIFFAEGATLMKPNFISSLLAGAVMLTAVPAHSIEILFAHVGDYGTYVDDGNRIAAMAGGAAGANVTVRHLNQAVYNDYGLFDQVWVYDLYHLADESATQLDNYQAIANWYNDGRARNMIVDGRIISSDIAWRNPPETAYIQNYVSELDQRGGGLMLGTDHNVVREQWLQPPFSVCWGSVRLQAVLRGPWPWWTRYHHFGFLA
jgi:hypothetical protein